MNAESHHTNIAQREQFQHTVDKTKSKHSGVLLLLSTVTSQDYKDYTGGEGKTLGEEMLYYTGTYTNIHSYPNKLTNKRIEQQEALNISSVDKCKDERAKKARQHTGTLSPRSSDKYSTSRLGCENNTSARTLTPYLSFFSCFFCQQ